MAGFFLWYKSFPNVRGKFLSDKFINMISVGELNLNMAVFFLILKVEVINMAGFF
jgi:hypothetical protein